MIPLQRLKNKYGSDIKFYVLCDIKFYVPMYLLLPEFPLQADPVVPE